MKVLRKENGVFRLEVSEEELQLIERAVDLLRQAQARSVDELIKSLDSVVIKQYEYLSQIGEFAEEITQAIGRKRVDAL